MPWAPRPHLSPGRGHRLAPQSGSPPTAPSNRCRSPATPSTTAPARRWSPARRSRGRSPSTAARTSGCGDRRRAGDAPATPIRRRGPAEPMVIASSSAANRVIQPGDAAATASGRGSPSIATADDQSLHVRRGPGERDSTRVLNERGDGSSASAVDRARGQLVEQGLEVERVAPRVLQQAIGAPALTSSSVARSARSARRSGRVARGAAESPSSSTSRSEPVGQAVDPLGAEDRGTGAPGRGAAAVPRTSTPAATRRRPTGRRRRPPPAGGPVEVEPVEQAHDGRSGPQRIAPDGVEQVSARLAESSGARRTSWSITPWSTSASSSSPLAQIDRGFGPGERAADERRLADARFPLHQQQAAPTRRQGVDHRCDGFQWGITAEQRPGEVRGIGGHRRPILPWPAPSEPRRPGGVSRGRGTRGRSRGRRTRGRRTRARGSPW